MTKGELISALLRASEIPDDAEVIVDGYDWSESREDPDNPGLFLGEGFDIVAVRSGTEEKLAKLGNLQGFRCVVPGLSPAEIGLIQKEVMKRVLGGRIEH